MNKETWTAVDAFFGAHLLPHDQTLDDALDASVAAGLPPIAVTPAQGKLLHLLARLMGARRVLEVGTLGGYSTIWLARGLPSDGRVVTLEVDPHHAEVAASNFLRAGVSDRIDLRLGSAHDTLPRLAEEGGAPFDLVFIDADKASIPEYFAWALQLTRPGSAIVVDNVVRNGAVADPETTDPNNLGVRRFAESLAREPRVSATTIQTVGAKGYDGFTLALVVTAPTSR